MSGRQRKFRLAKVRLHHAARLSHARLGCRANVSRSPTVLPDRRPSSTIVHAQQDDPISRSSGSQVNSRPSIGLRIRSTFALLTHQVQLRLQTLELLTEFLLFRSQLPDESFSILTRFRSDSGRSNRQQFFFRCLILTSQPLKLQFQSRTAKRQEFLTIANGFIVSCQYADDFAINPARTDFGGLPATPLRRRQRKTVWESTREDNTYQSDRAIAPTSR